MDAPILLSFFDSFSKDLIFKKAAVIINGIVNSAEFLGNDASCANIQVPDFWIAELSLGKSHIISAGGKFGVWIIFEKGVDERLVCFVNSADFRILS